MRVAWFSPMPPVTSGIATYSAELMPCLSDEFVLSSDAFKAASPYNAAFAQSMDIVQDFWNVPVYNELIASTAQQLGEALDGKKSSKDALSELAAEHEKILSQAQ